VRTDRVQGFLLDRGFQVLSTAYPEAQRVLDYGALDLRRFQCGAYVRFEGEFHCVADPWREPRRALAGALGPIGTLRDRFRLLLLRRRLLSGPVGTMFERPETTALHALKTAGFSQAMIDRFFRPMFGGVLLDPDLQSSSRMFDFTFRMFAEGDAALPAGGMGAIPEQLSGRLTPGSVRLGARVESLDAAGLKLEGGEKLATNAVVIASAGPEAARLCADVQAPRSRSSACLYFAAPQPPLHGAWLVLNGNNQWPIQHLAVLSEVSRSYAPPGQSLVCVTVPGKPLQDDAGLEIAVREQLWRWFGRATREWQHLRTYRIAHALPDLTPLRVSEQPARLRRGLYVCGDHRATASINGAMVSGRKAAEALIEDFG
jgi:phytoene dehydrogenase-like protein